jgi:hypothetical protein
MPRGGKYSTNPAANQQLASAIRCAGDMLTIQPGAAVPSYCSGATYLVFLATLEELAKGQQIAISRSALDASPGGGKPRRRRGLGPMERQWTRDGAPLC